MHFDNFRLSFSSIYFSPFSNLGSLFLTFMSFRLWLLSLTMSICVTRACDHWNLVSLQMNTQPKTRLYLLSHPSIANSYHGEVGPYVPLPTGGELSTDIVMYRPKVYKFSCCKLMFKMTVLWLEDGILYAFSLISRSLYFSLFGLHFSSLRCSDTNVLFRDMFTGKLFIETEAARTFCIHC